MYGLEQLTPITCHLTSRCSNAARKTSRPTGSSRNLHPPGERGTHGIKTGNRVPPATPHVGVAMRAGLLSIVAFGFLTGLASAVLSENMPVSANELVREVIKNEIKVEAADHSRWAFLLQTEKAGKRELDQVVETKDGNLQLPISVNGRPLTTKEKQQANLHIQKLVHDPGALRKSLREESADTTRTQSLLKMLPDAFNFSYEDRSSGDLVKLKFSPNPHFRPPSHEAQVFHAMEGEMKVDNRRKRLAELSGHLLQAVKFGGGLLGHLDKGGQFSVKQEQVSPGFWELTVLNVQMKGKALFFKTIAVQQKTLRSGFRRVSDDLTLAEAADILRKSVPRATMLQDGPSPDNHREEL